MGQFSEMMGSFIRTGNFPIEANYIFKSEQELKDFYTDEINKAQLHEGLLKIVSTEDKQTLYWVTNVDGILVFKALISENTIAELLDKIKDLKDAIDYNKKDIAVENNDVVTLNIDEDKKLSAVLNIAEGNSNILKKQGNTLIASVTSQDVTCADGTLAEELSKILKQLESGVVYDDTEIKNRITKLEVWEEYD